MLTLPFLLHGTLHPLSHVCFFKEPHELGCSPGSPSVQDVYGTTHLQHKRWPSCPQHNIVYASVAGAGVVVEVNKAAGWRWTGCGGVGCQHTVNIQSTYSQHTVNIQSTYSQHTVNIPVFPNIPLGFRILRAFKTINYIKYF